MTETAETTFEIDPPQEIIDQLISLFEREARDVVMAEAGKLLEAFPASYMLWKLFGGALLSEGHPVQAEIALKQALTLRPDLEEAKSNYAIIRNLLDDLAAQGLHVAAE